MAAPRKPVLLPCHGTSSRGVSAEDVAADLAARGLAEVIDDIESIVAAARAGRDVLALDGCAAGCQARLLDARGVQTLRALNLEEDQPEGSTIADASSVPELQAATSPLRRMRPTLRAPTGELSTHPSHSLDDYFLALDTLTSPIVECGALADAPTLAAHVAHILGVSRPAAGEALARLQDAGYIQRGAHKDVLLTPSGRNEADRVLRKQRILECFAVSTLDYGLADCYERAREIAPGFDDETLDRIWNALGRPDHCPHGWPVDPDRARHESRGLLALSAAPAAKTVRVERLDETSGERLHALIDSGIEPARTLSNVTVNTAAAMVSYTVGNRDLSISLTLAAATLVRAA